MVAAPYSTDCINALGRGGTNGIPDNLDEARCGLDGLLKLHPAQDQLYHQVADDRDHAGLRLPLNEVVDFGWGNGGARPVYFADGKPQGLKQYQSASTGVANLAGRYAAAMALAYQIWKDDPQQKDFAARCLKAGLEVYELGRAKEGVQQGNSYGAPYRYEETTWADDMEWGAAELFRATKESRFLADAKRYAERAADEGWMGQEQTGHYQYYPFMNVGHFRLYDLVDTDFQELLAGYYRAGIKRCILAGEKKSLSDRRSVHLVFEQSAHGTRQSMPDVRAHDWRSAVSALCRQTTRLVARSQSLGHDDVHRDWP
jgi:hypothetical protein